MMAQSKKLLQQKRMLEKKSSSLSVESFYRTIDLVHTLHDSTLLLDISSTLHCNIILREIVARAFNVDFDFARRYRQN